MAVSGEAVYDDEMVAPVKNDVSTSEKLLSAVMTIAAEPGPGRLSSRAVAELAGVSAASINYIFGSFDPLVQEAKRFADGQLAGFWRDELDALGGQAFEARDFAAIVFLTTRRSVVQCAGQHSLVWHDVIESARLGRPPRFGASFRAEAEVWTAVLQQAGLTRLRPELLHAFSLALRFGYTISDGPDAFDPWAMALVNRFADRLLGTAPDTGTDSFFRQRAEQDANLSDSVDVSAHQTARAIVATAVKTVLEAGVEAATFREIAKRASLSVSSVQHFFGSRRAYLLAAFHAIYATARDRAVKDAPAPGTLTVEDVSRFFEGQHSDGAVIPHSEFAAIQGLMLSAAELPETQALARGLFARTGQTSLQLLKAMKDARGEIGRLDAQIVSLTLTHLVTLEVVSPGIGPESELAEPLSRNLLKVLFGS